MKKNTKNLFSNNCFLVVFIFLILGFLFWLLFFNQKQSFILQQNENSFNFPTITTTPSFSETLKSENEKSKNIPSSYKIENVPFTPQAPFARWDFDHNEACEEAAILMVHYFYQNKLLTPSIADKEIMAMVNYQKKNWGGHFDLEAKEIAKLAEEYFGYKNTRIIYNATIEDIKKEIAENRPVILPTAGRLLKNPNYRRPGPLYHALVAIGYTENKIITHDPGTRKGEEFTYPYETVEEAMHEWNNGNVYKGRKTAIILK